MRSPSAAFRIEPARRSSSRRASWPAVLLTALLIFKAAVPLLASAAAQLQGRQVADICEVYGVRLAASPASEVHHAGHQTQGHVHPDGHASAHPAAHTSTAAGDTAASDDRSAPPPEPGHEPGGSAGHERQHCALGALAVLAGPDLLAGSSFALATGGDGRTGAPIDAALPPDASARWLASRLHAPPTAA